MVRGHEEKVSRISISLQPQLQEEFDEVSRRMGYYERSKALQIAIRNLIGVNALKTAPESSVTGGILLLFDHEKHGVDHEITELGHEYKSVIVSSTHLHVDDKLCINITTVRGSYREIARLEQDLRRVDGVEQVKSTYFVI